MAWLLNLWRTEPARIVGFATALVAFLVAFGVQFSTQQQVGILGLVSALLIVLGAEVTRSQVDSPATSLDRAAKAYDLGLENGNRGAAMAAYQQSVASASFQAPDVIETAPGGTD